MTTASTEIAHPFHQKGFQYPPTQEKMAWLFMKIKICEEKKSNPIRYVKCQFVMPFNFVVFAICERVCDAFFDGFPFITSIFFSYYTHSIQLNSIAFNQLNLLFHLCR